MSCLRHGGGRFAKTLYRVKCLVTCVSMKRETKARKQTVRAAAEGQSQKPVSTTISNVATVCVQEGSGIGSEQSTEFCYWPWYKKPPDGWVIEDDFADCHHGAHAVLLRKVV